MKPMTRLIAIIHHSSIASTASVAISAFFVPIQYLLFGMLFLVIADNVTGIMKSWKLGDKKIHSHGIGLTLAKLSAYLILILSAFFVDEFIITFPSHTDYFTKIVAGAIAFRELISILENVETITGGKLISIVKNILLKGFKTGLSDTLDEEQKDKK